MQAATQTPTRPPSIRRAYLVRLLGPLLVLTLLAATAAFGLARHFSDAVLDLWMHDSVISLANRVQWSTDGVVVDLPQGAREMLEWDRVDKVYYEVILASGQRAAGNAMLPSLPGAPPAFGETLLYEGQLDHVPIRVHAVAVHGPDGQTAIVKIAETQHKRAALARQLLWISVVIALLLAALSCALVWSGIGRGIAAIERAVGEVRRVDSRSALEPITIPPDMPVEVAPLVQQINRLIDEVSASHRSMQRFVVNAAHQVRTPVAALQVQLENALQETDAAARAESTRRALMVAQHMGRMLHQLLMLARADEGSGAGVAPVDIDRIARDEVERRFDQALAVGVDLGYDGPNKPVVVLGSRELFREALVNLVDNALRYAASGRQVTVGVSDTPVPQFYVEDQGPGIDAHERTKLGDRFYRIPGTPGDGCGLGLSIVTEIARRFGGTFVADEGRDGRGLCARVVFAAAAPQSA